MRAHLSQTNNNNFHIKFKFKIIVGNLETILWLTFSASLKCNRLIWFLNFYYLQETLLLRSYLGFKINEPRERVGAISFFLYYIYLLIGSEVSRLSLLICTWFRYMRDYFGFVFRIQNIWGLTLILGFFLRMILNEIPLDSPFFYTILYDTWTRIMGEESRNAPQNHIYYQNDSTS